MMKNKNDLDSNKVKILNESKKLFAEKGFDGTSIGQIAQKANVAKGLIFHYFDNKATLWRQVKETIILSDNQTESLDVKNGLLAFLTQLVNARIHSYSQHPELVRIMLWQHLQKDKDQLAGIEQPLYSPTLWHPSIIMLQQKGQLRTDMTVEMIIVFIANSISAIFAQDYFEISHDKAQLQTYQEKIIDCLYQALKVRL
ncbi:TetR/AcrR family transcriptional regulator [uncultured Shewanella sp.]|uniref:TetR/AcrR family transcriptional regulator n=1 Tax=uncultured Shewanella sp. TaxID=173975 RepID=UPI0026185BDE|nr:TetR/AcrR family transcriptional regulator [uncultured Shewanella sp.]